jgi:NAD(P)-dependent dehydrogenase (short-subunit alcohol dehydrogenase family)
MSDFGGKTAVVTGGSKGFGRGIVEALAAQGLRVVAVAREPSGLEQLRREVPGNIQSACGDVTDPVFVARTIERERPQVLVLNAGARGVNRPTRLHTWETFSAQYAVDVKAAFLWVREALTLPLEKGSAIFLSSSGAALRPTFVNAAYASAKAAIWTFAQGVAPEARELGIHVHCLLPAMAAESEVGREALRDFSRYTGASVEQIVQQKGLHPPVTGKHVGGAVAAILDQAKWASVVGFRISAEGPSPIE